MVSLPVLLSSWRRAAGLTPETLAPLVSRSARSVREWEKGSPCSAETVGAIGRACGVPDLQRLEAVATAAGEGEGWVRLRAVLRPVVGRGEP